MTSVFAPAVAGFATFEPHWNASLFKQGTELEAISRGNLEMSIASAQELAEFFPEFSIFSAGYLHRDAEHQKKVFAADLFKPFKQMTEDKLGVKLLSVMYLGRRQLNLRTDKRINTPEDLAGVKLRMPGADAWMFLGRALGANPTPVAFTEIYTALQTGAVDGQFDRADYEAAGDCVLSLSDNPLFVADVAAGKLPPVAERLPEAALVVQPYAEIGTYGGTMFGLALQPESGTSEVLSWHHANLVRYADDQRTNRARTVGHSVSRLPGGRES
jgi:hypothetical protein